MVRWMRGIRDAEPAGIRVAALSAVILVGSVMTGAARAQDADVEEGQALVELNCSGCHAVGRRDASPHPQAPLFRKLSERYPLDALEEAFASGYITSAHPDMPDFVARPDQVDAILAYIGSIQED